MIIKSTKIAAAIKQDMPILKNFVAHLDVHYAKEVMIVLCAVLVLKIEEPMY